jgi:hypothetical protein
MPHFCDGGRFRCAPPIGAHPRFRLPPIFRCACQRRENAARCAGMCPYQPCTIRIPRRCWSRTGTAFTPSPERDASSSLAPRPLHPSFTLSFVACFLHIQSKCRPARVSRISALPPQDHPAAGLNQINELDRDKHYGIRAHGRHLRCRSHIVRCLSTCGHRFSTGFHKLAYDPGVSIRGSCQHVCGFIGHLPTSQADWTLAPSLPSSSKQVSRPFRRTSPPLSASSAPTTAMYSAGCY